MGGRWAGEGGAAPALRAEGCGRGGGITEESAFQGVELRASEEEPQWVLAPCPGASPRRLLTNSVHVRTEVARTASPDPDTLPPMPPLLAPLLASAAAPQNEGGLIDSAEGLFAGMVLITVVAGWLDVVQKARQSALWPVPLVIYATMMPVMTFIIVLSQVKGEPVHPGNLAAIVSPLPLILFLRLRGRKG